MSKFLDFLKHPMRDYRRLTLKRMLTKEFNYIFYLIFWVLYPPVFCFLEHGYKTDYHVVYLPIDSVIPFCELFVIPYVFWFGYLFAMHLYTIMYDIDAFKSLMRFIIITYTTTVIIYFLFPTVQNLRPAPGEFPRDNALTRYMQSFYAGDTNTNVCPSLHVLGTFAALYAQWNARGLNYKPVRIVFSVLAVLICVSTVFLKQHSVLDVLMALPLAFIALVLCELWRKKTVPDAAVRAELLLESK